MIYKVKNWERFQHYRDRNPPWIKLHFALLSSSDWVTLDDASRVLAIACMLVASRNEGQIDGSASGLAFLKRVAYLNRAPSLKPLIDCGFLESASANASNTLADARPETENLIQTQDLKQGEKSAAAPLPDWLEVEPWEAYVKSRPAKARTPASLQAALKKLAGFRERGHNPNEIVATSLANGWQGLFEPDPRRGQQAPDYSEVGRQ